MEDTNTVDAQVIADLSAATIGVQFIGERSIPFVVVPEGYTVEKLERLLPEPTRRRGADLVRDVASFIAVVNRFKNAATTLYRRTRPEPRFLACFNDHSPEAPGWRDHCVVYECPISPEWHEWTKASGRSMSQTDFALFIERNLPDLVTMEGGPTPAQMLEVSRTLQAKKKVNFASGTRLDNGEIQFRYEEQIEGTAGKGDIKIPEQFHLGIPVFEGGEPYAVVARLRYRIGERGELSMWFDLERPHKIVEDAVLQLVAKVEVDTGLVPINGEPSVNNV